MPARANEERTRTRASWGRSLVTLPRSPYLQAYGESGRALGENVVAFGGIYDGWLHITIIPDPENDPVMAASAGAAKGRGRGIEGVLNRASPGQEGSRMLQRGLSLLRALDVCARETQAVMSAADHRTDE